MCYSGVYWICASSNCTDVREVFCDMRSGGWTLIGQVGGVDDNIYDKWLVTNHNTEKLRTPVIEAGTYGCIDSVDLAVNYAREVSRFWYSNKIINVIWFTGDSADCFVCGSPNFRHFLEWV